MIQVAVFDVDGTLAPYNQPMAAEDLSLLKQMEASGMRLVLCSGKPVFYQCAFARQLGLLEPIFIGENGAEIQGGISLPPRFHYRAPYSDEAKQSLAFFKEKIRAAIPDIWFQPNTTELSPFPKCPEEFEIIDSIIEQNRARVRDIHIIKYFDCFDFIPANINKGTGVLLLAQKLGVSPENMISVGDSQNDYPMFAVTGDSVGIRLKDPSRAKHHADSLHEALEYILALQ